VVLLAGLVVTVMDLSAEILAWEASRDPPGEASVGDRSSIPAWVSVPWAVEALVGGTVPAQEGSLADPEVGSIGSAGREWLDRYYLCQRQQQHLLTHSCRVSSSKAPFDPLDELLGCGHLLPSLDKNFLLLWGFGGQLADEVEREKRQHRAQTGEAVR